MKKLIKLHNVSKTYKGINFEVNALKDINLEIEEGTYCSIIGKSGSGKSSLIKIIGLLDFDYEGEYSFNNNILSNQNKNELTKRRKKIGFVFQDFQLIQRYTIKQNMEIASVIKQGYVDQREIEKILTDINMLDKKDSYPEELSGGQKQRIAIARAMIAKPELLIADEPTGSLDQENTLIILKLLKNIHKTTGTTLIVVTHDKEVAEQSERIIKLEDGKITNDYLLF